MAPRAAADAGRRTALRIVQRHFGSAPRQLERLEGGLTNEVFSFTAGRDRCVVRINTDATKIQHFLKEQWAMEQARTAGVPTPQVLEVGNEAQGCAYIIVQHESGVPGCDHPQRLDLLRQLGALSLKLHRVRTHGFGSVFDWSANRLSHRSRWSEFLDVDLCAEQRVELLKRQAMLAPAAAEALAASLAEMRRWRKPAVLQHGDLRLKNVLVDASTGRIAALLDWEHCLSAPAPYWDLSVALHDLGVDDKEALLDGYGVTPRRFERIAAHLKALNLLNYAPIVEAAVRGSDPARLAWLKLRLRGALDIALN